MKGAVFDYHFGQKTNWRRWAWNRVSERISNKGNGIAVYLPSANDFDRRIAISKGFRDENLIGVERNSGAIKHARNGGSLVVKGDFFETVEYLAGRVRVSVVFGDFCCGLDPDIVGAVARLCLKDGMEDSVFAFNLLRGRDPGSNALRESFREDGRDNADHKHRAITLAKAVLVFISMQVQAQVPDGDCRSGEGRLAEIMLAKFSMIPKWAFSTYKSKSGQYFDSVVFVNPIRALMAMWCFDKQDAFSAERKSHFSARAILAHRTMRIGGALGDSYT